MGAVDTTYTFTATDTITSTKMNNIIDQTTITTDAILGTTLEVSSGKLKIRSQGVTSNELATNAVTTTAISDLSITTAKIADSNVTTVKIADANVTPEKLSQPLTLGTEKATTSGTTVEFTGIPSWVKRITMILNGVGTNGVSGLFLRIGDSGGIATTSYRGAAAGIINTSTTITASTSAIVIGGQAATDQITGHCILTKVSGNTWIASGVVYVRDNQINYLAGTRTLTGSLTQLLVFSSNGIDTFDTGSINIMYE